MSRKRNEFSGNYFVKRGEIGYALLRKGDGWVGKKEWSPIR
jgi:hypothetical protein